MNRFGHVPAREEEFNLSGYGLYWKVDKKNVNQGTCYYRLDKDTYYVKATGRRHFIGGEIAEIGTNPKDVGWLEIIRNHVDTRYNTIEFFVSPPHDDKLKIKIIPCDNHSREHGSTTFFRIDAVNNLTTNRSFSSHDDYDIYQFRIGKNTDQSLAFRLQFFCWTMCKRASFSNKRDDLLLNVIMRGPGMDPIKLSCSLNIQQNPGRGSGAVGSSKKTIQNAPHAWNAWSAGTPHYPGNNTMIQPNMTFQNLNHRIRLELDVPQNFQLILGEIQTKIELDNLQRDINMLVINRLNDAINRKILVEERTTKRNEELIAENNQLKRMNQNLGQTALVTYNNGVKIMKLNEELRKELTAWKGENAEEETQ